MILIFTHFSLYSLFELPEIVNMYYNAPHLFFGQCFPSIDLCTLQDIRYTKW